MKRNKKNKKVAEIKHFLKVTLGVILIAAGIIGWVLPFIPGTLMIIGGLILVGYTAKDIRNIKAKDIVKKFKKILNKFK